MHALLARINAQMELIGKMKIDQAVLEQVNASLEEQMKELKRSHTVELTNKDKMLQTAQNTLKAAQGTISNLEAMQVNEHKAQSSVKAAYQKNANALSIKQRAKQKENEKTKRNVQSIHSMHRQYNQQNQQYNFLQMSQVCFVVVNISWCVCLQIE